MFLVSSSTFLSISKVCKAVVVIEQIKFLPSLKHRAHFSVHSTLFVALLIKGQIVIMYFLLSSVFQMAVWHLQYRR